MTQQPLSSHKEGREGKGVNSKRKGAITQPQPLRYTEKETLEALKPQIQIEVALTNSLFP